MPLDTPAFPQEGSLRVAEPLTKMGQAEAVSRTIHDEDGASIRLRRGETLVGTLDQVSFAGGTICLTLEDGRSVTLTGCSALPREIARRDLHYGDHICLEYEEIHGEPHLRLCRVEFPQRR